MLVLSRQRDETIMIGDDIEITIVDIRGDKVRLGITAPATIPVHRKEVYDAIQRENAKASRVKMEDLGSLPKGTGRPMSVPPGLHRPIPQRPREEKRTTNVEVPRSVAESLFQKDLPEVPDALPTEGHKGPQVVKPSNPKDSSSNSSFHHPPPTRHEPSPWRK